MHITVLRKYCKHCKFRVIMQVTFGSLCMYCTTYRPALLADRQNICIYVYMYVGMYDDIRYMMKLMIE